jgi:hypothetical protein
MSVADSLLNSLRSAEQTTGYKSVFITEEGEPCEVFRLVPKIAKSDY